jgi:glycosyltransferase involved in cell wall biosynthesis
VVTHNAPDFRGHDLVHAFAVGLDGLRRCRRHGMPIALSPIYSVEGRWPPPRGVSERWNRWSRRYRSAARAFVETARGRKEQFCSRNRRRALNARVRFEMADLLLPNSQSEADTIIEQLGVTTPYHVVPNAADPQTYSFDDPRDHPDRRYVTCVGRIEKLKNQLGLIEALRNTDYPVRIVGPSLPGPTRQYHQRCCRRATGNIEFLGARSGDDLVDVYRQTRVHVLPSDSETTGLASLEAALCGANIVTTDRGYTKDYFEDMAWYCQANSARSIRNAVEAAWAAPYRDDLRQKILRQYTWFHAADATLAGYRKMLSERTAGPPGPTAATRPAPVASATDGL